jgi:hypothetical protein
MKRFLLSLSAIAAGFCSVNAQTNFVPGIIITLQHDSLRGFVNFINWPTNPGEIDFKSENGAESRKYKATEITGFVISQKNIVYLSKHITADITYYETSTLREKAMAMEMVDATVFLERLVAGEYELFSYRDIHYRDHYLYQAAGDAVTELKYIKTIIPTEDGAQLYERKIYQEQLEALFRDDPKLVRQIRNLNYYQSPLVKVFAAYNNYKNPLQSVKVDDRRNPVWFGIMGGVAFNSYKFRGDHYLNTSYSRSTNPEVGVFIDIPVFGVDRSFSIYNEILYKTVNTSGTLQHFFYSGQTVTWDFSYIQVNIMAHYTYPKGLVKPFIHAGMGNAFILNTRRNDIYSPSRKEYSDALDGLTKHEQSAIVGIGATWSHLWIEGRFSTSSGWIPYQNASIAVNGLQVVAGVRF